MRFELSWLKAQQNLPIPKHYRFSYFIFERMVDVYYPILINYIVRYWRKLYWRFIWFCWEVGFVDTKINERFQWSDFFRIKTH